MRWLSLFLYVLNLTEWSSVGRKRYYLYNLFLTLILFNRPFVIQGDCLSIDFGFFQWNTFIIYFSKFLNKIVIITICIDTIQYPTPIYTRKTILEFSNIVVTMNSLIHVLVRSTCSRFLFENIRIFIIHSWKMVSYICYNNSCLNIFIGISYYIIDNCCRCFRYTSRF